MPPAPARDSHEAPRSSAGAQVLSPAFFRDDAQFVDALRAGRADAQAELYRRHYRRVSAVLHRVMGRDQDLDDLAQEVFVRAVAGAAGFRGTAESVEPWLVRIAVYVARGTIRKRLVWRRFFRLEDPDSITATVPGTPPEQVEAVRRTYDLLDRLPTAERIALSLNLIDEMTVPQVAHACGVSESTIKRRLRKARHRFESLASRDPVLRDRISGGAR